MCFCVSQAGRSRSATIVTAYLMKTHKLRFAEAYQRLRDLKPDVQLSGSLCGHSASIHPHWIDFKSYIYITTTAKSIGSKWDSWQINKFKESGPYFVKFLQRYLQYKFKILQFEKVESPTNPAERAGSSEDFQCNHICLLVRSVTKATWSVGHDGLFFKSSWITFTL